MHSETKQTERKVLAGPRMETGGRCPTLPELPKGLNGKAFVKSGEGGGELVDASFLVQRPFVHTGKATMFL